MFGSEVKPLLGDGKVARSEGYFALHRVLDADGHPLKPEVLSSAGAVAQLANLSWIPASMYMSGSWLPSWRALFGLASTAVGMANAELFVREKLVGLYGHTVKARIERFLLSPVRDSQGIDRADDVAAALERMAASFPRPKMPAPGRCSARCS